MTNQHNRKLKVQYLSDWSLVRLEDGSVGVLTKRGESGRVTLPGKTGVDVRLEDELELIKHPAELAAEAMERYYIDGLNIRP